MGSGTGSSPLARGLPVASARRTVARGIIPARAGFTAVPPGGVGAGQDHPRSRGVYDPGDRPDPVRPGSSPLARGLRLADPVLPHVERIIPARAGFTVDRGAAHAWSPDHPRSRGVYRNTYSPTVGTPGSSPLARGLPADILGCRVQTRIIPARAGFTHQPERGHHVREDHPRSRGVYAPRAASSARTRGSSPLARGLPVPAVRAWIAGRIIPARAGFTQGHQGGGEDPQDHPRSRGVYRPARAADRADPRIIPARAGFTLCSASSTT
mgnify:CR=1 FL=1